MVNRNQLTQFIYQAIGQDLLNQALLKDELANGVQILGQEKVAKVALGVSCTEDFLKSAVKAKAQFCIFHHGLDPRTFKARYPRFSQKRLRVVFEHNLTIMGLHYVLDAHPQLGNNAVIIRELGAKLGPPLFEDWGYTGTFSAPQDVKQLSETCSKLFEHDIFAVFSGPEKVKTIGVVSGAGKPRAQHLLEMEQKGVELFITGEPSESTPHIMKESAINYFAGGHYATEVFGVQELGKSIKKEFKDKLEVEFIDIPNPI